MKTKKITFLDLFRAFLKYSENPDLIEEVKSEETIKGYTAKYNNVMVFLAEKKQTKIYAEDFTVMLANQLVTYMRESCSQNYSVRTAEICENVLRFGFKKGYLKTNPIYGLHFKKSKPKPIIFLTPDEVTLFENYNGPLKRFADMFLFQCYTGMAFMDLMTVTEKNIIDVTTITENNELKVRQYIIKNRGKTTIEANIPYFEKTKLLWEKYNCKFKKISGDKYRGYLKKISKELGITKNVTSHTGRKTCAMIKLNYEGYGIGPVSKILGHASIKTTETFYAKTELTLVSKELDRLGI